MAVYNFSALADGQAITFDVNADDLVFDQAAISAAQLSFTQEGAHVRVAVVSGTAAGKDVLLSNVSILQLAQANVQFANGSAIRFGDNAVALNDDNANSIAGTGFADLIHGFGGNDSIQGNAGADVIAGGAGNDLIGGNNDNDTIDGGAGNDSLGGGGGQDTFLFRDAGAANADALTDFSTNWDRIHVDAGHFTAAGAAGRLVAGDDRFHAAAGATGGADAEDRFVYNTTTRQLFYDADGNGAQAAQLIATLQAGANLVATDITVLAAATPPPPPPPGTINGTAGNDSLTGTDAGETINGLGGNDTLIGGQGDDALNGGDGDDTLDARDGSRFEPFADTLSGGAGDDVYHVNNYDGNSDVVLGDPAGTDTVHAYGLAWTLGAGIENLVLHDPVGTRLIGTGNELDNLIDASDAEGSVLYGMGGDDVLISAALNGRSDSHGGDGNDTLRGGTHGDSLFGDGGDDVLSGGGSSDSLEGGAGADDFLFDYAPAGTAIADFAGGVDELLFDGTIYTALGVGAFSEGDDRFRANTTGNAQDVSDRLIFNTTTGELFYDPDGAINTQAGTLVAVLQPGATLSATDISVVNGSSSGSVITGGWGGDYLLGTEGNDTMDGLDAGDTLVGFGGDDLIEDTGTNWTNGTSDSLDGGVGNDTLRGNLGNDTLLGGEGVDELQGGDHFDTYVFDVAAGAANADLVLGYETAQDSIVLDAEAMTALGSGGTLATNDPRFWAAAGASGGHDADDRLVYDTSSGRLWYDADGSGAGAAQLIATFQGAPVLGAGEFFIENGTEEGQVLNGTSGNDSITGTSSDDTITGFAGNDTLDGNDGADRLDGGTGDDSLVGGRWDGQFGNVGDVDTLIGGDGNDTLNGWSAGTFDSDVNAETLHGGLGNDVFMVDNDGDVLTDSGGVDTVRAHNIDWTLAAGFENLVLHNDNDFRIVGVGNGLDNVLGEQDTGWYAWYQGLGGNDTIYGTVQNDTLEGGDGNDVLDGGWDYDVVDGGAGNDRVFGGEDDLTDTLTGGAGADTFYFYGRFSISFEEVTDFASGADTLEFDGRLFETIGPSGRFAAGDGRFYAAAGATQGHDADDRLVYDTSSGNLWYDADGLGGQDAVLAARLTSAPGLAATDINVVNGTGGQTLNGTAGNDSLVGGSGHDTILGNAGNDTLVGNAGNDSLDGGSGTDRLDGGLGDDIFIVTTGDVLVDAGGSDWVHTAVNWTLATGFENAIMTGTGAVQIQGNNDSNYVQGNAANNYFNLRAGNDTIVGGAGNDTIDMSTGGTSSYGQDSIDGGAGIDTVDFAGYARSAVNANLAEGSVWGGGDGNTGDARLASIERFIGGGFNDRITGGGAAEYLDGRQGNDTVGGGAGVDTMLGGTGNDVFEFRQAAGAANADRVNDFASGADRLHLDNAVMAALGADGAFAAGDARFWAAAGANTGHDANDRVVYNTSTGQLWYDADGSGSGAALLVATLQAGAAVAATDISVI